MKTLGSSFSGAGLLLLWGALAVIAAFSLLAIAPSRIPIHAPAMSFGVCLAQANWRGVLMDGESGLASLLLLVVTALIVFYSLARSASARVGLLIFLLTAPALAFSDRATEFVLWFVRMPLLAVTGTVQALRSEGNGQFYGDGPFTLAALGWWTLLCLLLLSREGILWCNKRWKNYPQRRETGASQSAQSESEYE